MKHTFELSVWIQRLKEPAMVWQHPLAIHLVADQHHAVVRQPQLALQLLAPVLQQSPGSVDGCLGDESHQLVGVVRIGDQVDQELLPSQVEPNGDRSVRDGVNVGNHLDRIPLELIIPGLLHHPLGELDGSFEGLKFQGMVYVDVKHGMFIAIGVARHGIGDLTRPEPDFTAQSPRFVHVVEERLNSPSVQNASRVVAVAEEVGVQQLLPLNLGGEHLLRIAVNVLIADAIVIEPGIENVDPIVRPERHRHSLRLSRLVQIPDSLLVAGGGLICHPFFPSLPTGPFHGSPA